ncbi:MAG TPA: serine/threonine-protein kinase [Gemmatimonadaceae bacterium]
MSDAGIQLDPVAPLRAALARRYEFERELGRGAFATVWLARDLRHDRHVAIKVLRVDASSALPEMRFVREIHLLARLQHPHIVPLHDSGHLLDLVWYVMPCVEGESLRQRLERERRMEIREAVRLAREAADALGYAHGAGVVHRDIKPENILLSGRHAMIADFGIARIVDGVRSRQRLTDAGAGSPGTPAYMSPEQLMGETLDGRSDIYSLGCTLYEMLAGEAPFAGASGFARRFTEPPPSVARLRGDVPAPLDEAIRRAMERLPEDRFATAEQFADALAGAGPAQATRSVPVAAPRLLEPTAAAAPSSAMSPESSAAPRAADAPERQDARRARWLRPRDVALAAAALVLLSGATLALRGGAADAESGRRRVVVTPLVNHTGDVALEPVGMMMVDWVTAGLQRLPSLAVVPTPTALQAHRVAQSSGDGSRDPVRAVAEETGADLVVTGALYRRADRLLLRLQVTDTRSGQVVETLGDLEAPASDPIVGVEAARARLMGWFAGQDDERVRAEMAGAASPPTYAAYAEFSRGLDAYLESDFARAIPYFLSAHAADSSFVAALLYASLCHSNVGDFARSDSLLAIVDRSRASLGEYQRAWLDYRTAFLAGRHEQALAAIRRAARLAPDSKAAYNHGVAAFQSGHAAEAAAVFRAIVPERGPMRGFLAYWDVRAAVHHALGEFAEERAVGDSARRRYPDRLVAFMPIVRSFAVTGRIDSLDAALSLAASLPRDPSGPDFGELLLEAAEELRAHGHAEASARVLERAYSWYRAPARRASSGWALARAAYLLGWHAEADSLVLRLRAAEGDRPELLGLAALIDARAGARASALALADTLESMRRPYQFGVVPLYRARLAAALDDRAGAVARLREAFASGTAYDLWLHRDADLAVLRGHAPYEEMMDGKR